MIWFVVGFTTPLIIAGIIILTAKGLIATYELNTTTAAKCSHCYHPIERRTFPFCPNCRLLVIAMEDLELSPTAPIDVIYSEIDASGNETIN